MALVKPEVYDVGTNNNVAEAQNARNKEIAKSVNTTRNIQKSNANIYDPYYHFDDESNSYNTMQGIEQFPTTGGGLKYLYPSSSSSHHVMQASSLDGIFGIPYQFLDSVDRRLFPSDKNSLGRKYAQKIMVHAPLLMITPCRQKFMEGFNNEGVNIALKSLISGDQSLLYNIDKVGRYYSTVFAYDEYYKAVRIMCMEVAHFIGIADTEINYGGKRTKIKDIDWYAQKNQAFSKYFTAKNSVVLYADGLVQLSDSFSNNTTDSSIASSINGYSDKVKELKFLTGGSSALTNLYDNVKDGVSSALNAIENIGGRLTEGMLGDLAGTGVHTVLSGGKIIFPKIWSDSNNSRSYSFDIKLRSPDHDPISIFLNVLVPYIHLLALCLPQSITQGTAAQSPNAYDTPFLVRAYCKGMFNINMGIITDLSATRGAESQWNDQGLPTQIDVSISIEDLYSNLVMTNPTKDENIIKAIWDKHMDVVTNTEMLDFLSNLSGLNIAATQTSRKTEMFTQLLISDIKWAPSQIFHYFENGVSNIQRRVVERYFL